MAFTLQINTKNSAGNRAVNFETLLSNCHLRYGSDNEFYILEEGKINQNTAILYNPNRIGRGIYFSAGKPDGILEISYNIPTTEAEITDFLNVVSEVAGQLQEVEMYCVEEKRKYTLSELLNNKDNMVQFSLQSLNQFCSNKEYSSCIFSLAMWPFVLSGEQRTKFAICTDLKEFEQLLHEKQDMDVYYAKPALLRDKENNKIIAAYTLTEECESIFPLKAEGFLKIYDDTKIDEGWIRFFIYSEDRLADGIFLYDRFVSYILEHGAIGYDERNILIPKLTKEQIGKMLKAIS